MPEKKDEQLTIQAASVVSKISESALRRAIATRRLNATRAEGRVTISREDLEHYRVHRRGY